MLAAQRRTQRDVHGVDALLGGITAKRVKQIKKSMVPRYYFAIMEVCLDHMDTIDSTETRARVVLALLERGVPEQYVSMLETYFLLGRV